MLKNTIKNLLEPPKYIYNSRILNYLNFQKIRIRNEEKKFNKKKLLYKDFTLPIHLKKDIDEFGYTVVENFFSKEDFKILSNSFNNYSKSNRVSYQENYYNMIWGSGLITRNSDKPNDAEIIINVFNKKKEFIFDLVSYIFKEKVKGDFELSYQDLKLMKGKEDDLDPNRMLHADKHYHCAKAFFAIEDINEFNSPYIYCPKSNIITTDRINFENKISKYRSKNKKPYKITNQDLSELNLMEKEIFVKKNTLVISDNIGFHKRGRMLINNTRKQIRLSFHYLQANSFQRYIRSSIRKII